MTVTLHLGDCIEVMRTLPEASVDAIVTDPPYGLEFMGKDWDSFRDPSDPTSERHRGKNSGTHGELAGGSYADGSTKAKVSYGGGGKRPSTQRCTVCGKRDQFNQQHEPCGVGQWERVALNPYAAPPAMLAFQSWCEVWATEALRVLKPGGHLAAFGGTRTYHRMACAVEDAGFEIRDTLAWMYGSGFPKSLNVSKAIDRANGDERPVMSSFARSGRSGGILGTETEIVRDITSAASAASAAWDGWGTALKPAYEPIVLARKPLVGTVAANVLAHGTGALNVDACRIGSEGGAAGAGAGAIVFADGLNGPRGLPVPGMGRWPANVLLDEAAAAMLDATAGQSVSRIGQPRGAGSGDGWGMTATGAEYADSGGPSRFFYTAKASRSEREAGLEGMALQHRGDGRDPDLQSANMPAQRATARRNDHPTVKPVDLMRWLCRLVTPPGGLILDPFLGSGTTAMAALDEGFRVIGIDREERYITIARHRILHRHLLAPETREPTEKQPTGRLL